MIDRYIAARGKDSFSDDYTPDQAIQSKQLLNPDSDRLAVVFPPWHGRGKITDTLLRRLQKNNWAVLNYDLHDQILEPHIDRVPESFGHIQREVAADLTQIQAEAAYERLHFIGISLGTMSMTLVAEEYPDFTSATFVLPCSELASSMWVGSRTHNIRRVLEEQGHTRTDVVEAWRELEPKTYAHRFKQKPVVTIISKKDPIILPSYQLEMNNELKNAGAKVSDKHRLRGHGATILSYCFSGKI